MPMTEEQAEHEVEQILRLHLAKMRDLQRVGLRVVSGLTRTNTLSIATTGQARTPADLQMERGALEELRTMLSPIDVSDKETTEADLVHDLGTAI